MAEVNETKMISEDEFGNMKQKPSLTPGYINNITYQRVTIFNVNNVTSKGVTILITDK